MKRNFMQVLKDWTGHNKNLLYQDIRESELCSRPGLSVWDGWVAFLRQVGIGIWGQWRTHKALTGLWLLLFTKAGFISQASSPRVQKNVPLSLAKVVLVFSMLHSVQMHPKESPAHPLIARKILCEMLALAVFGSDSLGRRRMLTEEKGANEHLSCQSSLFLSDPHTSRATPFCQELPDPSPQGELVPFDDVLRECEATNNNILRAYQILNAHVWEQEAFSLPQRQLLLDCPFCLKEFFIPGAKTLPWTSRTVDFMGAGFSVLGTRWGGTLTEVQVCVRDRWISQDR